MWDLGVCQWWARFLEAADLRVCVELRGRWRRFAVLVPVVGKAGAGNWGARGWGAQSKGAHGWGTQNKGARGGARETGEPRASCGALWGLVVSDGACEGALVGRRGVARPGDVAAESRPAAWRRGSSGGARRSGVAGTSASRVVARWWPCLAVGQASPVHKVLGTFDISTVDQKKIGRAHV